MSQSARRVYKSKGIISSRNIGYSSHLNSQMINSESQFRGVKSKNIMQTSKINVGSQSMLQWEGVAKSIVYKSGSDLQELLGHRNILLDLISQFEGRDKIVVEGRQRDDFNKRLILLEGQIQGLLRRKITFQSTDNHGVTRQLDYTVILNEKQNQIIELEKKIQNLEERMRRMQGRESELENEVVYLNEQMRRKNEIIEHKDRTLLQEVAFSKQMVNTIDSIKRSSVSRNILADMVIPSLDIIDIKASAKRIIQSKNASNDIIKLIREFENASLQQGSKLNTQSIIEGWIMGLPRDSILRVKFTEGQRRINQQRRYSEMQEKFSLAGQIYQQQLSKLKAQNPGMKIQVDDHIFSVLKNPSTSAFRVGDVIQVQRTVQKTVQVPVQDTRTKHLIHLLASNYKKLFTKYPKLYDQIDIRLSQFFSQQLIDVMQVDELDRVVEVVKYIPQVVKVQNVYAYSSQKSRKVQFHLRVLIKALLEQMQKIRLRSGIVFEIDQGVIGMIRQQIMDVVDVDDILKVYRVTPKIVQVEKIVEKIVERIIQVPKIIQVQRRVETPVQVKKYEVVENTVNIPVQVPRFETLIVEKLIQVPRIQERIVQVPKIIQKIIEVIKQVPRVIEVQKIIQKPVQIEKYIQIQKEIIVPITEYRNIDLVREKIVPTREIIEKSIPVDQIIQKIVQVRVEVPKIIEVEKIVQKIIQRVQYVPAPDIRNHIEIRYQPVDRYIEKIVPIIQTVQQIVQVPQIIQKIVQVHDVIEKPIEVEVVVEKIIYRDRIKSVERIVQKPVVEYRMVEKIIEKIVQVPLVKQIIKVEKQYIQKPVVQIVERIVHKEVEIEKPKILYQDRVKEVERIVNHFVKEPQIIRIVEDRIVPVEKIVERVKTVPTVIQKIIEKLVEVPKVVEVQKIVQKIVIIPRVIQKVVEVPQIVQKIVQKIITIPQIVEIQKIVNIPVIQERVIQVEAPRNVYLTVQKPVDVVREVLVRDEIYKETTKFQQMIAQRVVVQNVQIPRTLEVEKIVTNIVQQPKIIEINRDIIVPVEIQVPVDRFIEKIVPIEVVHREIQQVDKFRDRIVPIKQQQIKVVEVEKKVDNVVIQERIKQVERIVPYFQDRIVEVEKLREKIVPVERVIQQIKEVKQIVEKVVDRVRQIPKVYEIQKIIEKRVDVHKIIEVEKVVPQIIKVNKYIENIVQKIIEIPVLVQQLREIQVDREKIIQVKTSETNVKQVDRNIEKQVIVERLKQVTNNIHLIENTLQIVDRIIENNLDPVLVTQERIVEVPKIIEKIVEKIVVMPQIVQVLKYVHEIAQRETLGMAVSADIGLQENKYKDIAGGLKSQLEFLIVELRKTKSSNPSVRNQIESIEKFLVEYQNFLLYPRIQQIVKQQQVQKVVQKERPILVPFQSESNLRQQLAKTVLIQKLISELKSLKKQNPSLNFKNLDEDVNLIFLSQIGDSSKFSGEKFQNQLNEFSNSVQRKFAEMGGWSTDHQLMLNSFLQERFLMANVVKNSNETIKKTRAISEKRLEELRKVKEEKQNMTEALKSLEQILPDILSMTQKDKNRAMQSQVKTILSSIHSMVIGDMQKGEKSTRQLDQIVMDTRIQSMIREKDDLILQLKARLAQQTVVKQSIYYESKLKELSMQKSKIESDHSKCIDEKRRYVEEIQQLKIKIKQLQVQIQRVRILSPKESINTMNSFTSPIFNKRLQPRMQVSSRNSEKSQTDSQGYGRSYRNYGNYQQSNNCDAAQQNTYKYSINRGKKLMLGSQLSNSGNDGLNALGSKINSQNYIAGNMGAEYRSNQELESTSVNRMKMSALSGGATSFSPRNLLKVNGKKTYYETKYQG